MPRVVTLLVVVALATSCAPKTFSRALEALGYQRFQPPRNQVEPGALVGLARGSDGAVHVSPVCWREQAFPGLPRARPDASASQEIREKVQRSFQLEAEYLERLKADARFARVDDINLTLSNVSVLEYSDADLLARIGTRTRPCRQAVELREQRGDTVYTVMSVLRADVTYSIGSRADASGRIGLPPELLEGLKAELGGSHVSEREQTIWGDALHWGLRPDVFRAAPSAAGLGLERVKADALSEDQVRALIGPGASLVATPSEADLISCPDGAPC